MKLTRNKIRKIRKQQHQSVRKWKKARNSIRRKVATFRRTPQDIIPKRKNVFNKTLKNYIPLTVLEYLKNKYDNMRRIRRKQRRMKMIGGGGLLDLLSLSSVLASTALAMTDTHNNPTYTNSKDIDPATKPTEDIDKKNDTETGKDGPAAIKDGAETGKDGAEGDNKKGGGFSLGPDIPGDISIHSETHELKKANLTYKLVEFLLDNGLPYYIQIELKQGKTFNKHDTDIFDLRRILYGKFMPKADHDKIPSDKSKEIYFSEDKPLIIGIADGDTMQNEYPNDVFIFTGEKGELDKTSKDKTIKIKTGTEKTEVIVIDSKRLYVLSGDSPGSIDDKEDLAKLRGNPIDPSEFRLQVAPLSEADFKNAIASGDGDKKKKKKIVADDTNSYVVNLSVGCKITSIQTLRKSLEVVRADLEDEDNVSKARALAIFKMLTGLLQNPEFAKNDGFDDFKEKLFGFTYKIPGTERKYGFAQLMSFFEQEKDNLPKDLTKEFFMLLTLLGHGPAGENGACLAFDTPRSLEVIEYTKTLANGDIVTTKKLGSKMNMEGLGSELDKLNSTNTPKEEDAKADADAKTKADADAKKKADADAKTKADAAAKEEEAKKGEGSAESEESTAEGSKEDETDFEAGKTEEMSIELAEDEESKNKKRAGSMAIAALSAAEAAISGPTQAEGHISPTELPKEPIPTSQEVIAINKLYEKYDKKSEKVNKIISLKKSFNTSLKNIVTLLLNIFTKSLKSFKKSDPTSPQNNYVISNEKDYIETKTKLDEQLKTFKKSKDFKLIGASEYSCDNIVDEFTPSRWWNKTSDEHKEILMKICKLFSLYASVSLKIDQSYEYFKDWKKMKGATLGKPNAQDVANEFEKIITNLNGLLPKLDNDVNETQLLEQQLLN